MFEIRQQNELAQIYFWTGPVPFWTGPTECEPALQKRHFFFTLSFMINDMFYLRMFLVAMATCGNHEHALHIPIGDPVPQSHWSDALPPHPLLHQRGVLTVTAVSDWATDHCSMLFVHGRMARHRSNGHSAHLGYFRRLPPASELRLGRNGQFWDICDAAEGRHSAR